MNAKERPYLKKWKEKREFIFFSGSSDSRLKAKNIIGELLGKAKSNCLFIDPYFSDKDAETYIPFIGNLDCAIKILSSKSVMKQTLPTDIESTGVKLGKVLKGFANRMVQCSLMAGSTPEVHDRCLIIDDVAYILGSSFNEFGSRITTLFKVPEAKAFISMMDSLANKSITLQDWLKGN